MPRPRAPVRSRRVLWLGALALVSGLMVFGRWARDWWLRPEPVVLPIPVATADGARPPGCNDAHPSLRGKAFATPSGRSFHLWEAADTRQPLPVVLVLHGWYSNGREFQKWFEMEKFVEGAAHVVYPDSAGPMWDVMGHRDLDFVAELLDALSTVSCIDRARVLALGFSFGGKMAHHLGCKRPDLVRAVAVGDGSWDDGTPQCESPMPVLITHRSHDHDELLAWGQDAARRWRAVNGCGEAVGPSPLHPSCSQTPDCRAPGSVSFCEDQFYDASWPKPWNHTIREEYRALSWRWFAGLPR